MDVSKDQIGKLREWASFGALIVSAGIYIMTPHYDIKEIKQDMQANNTLINNKLDVVNSTMIDFKANQAKSIQQYQDLLTRMAVFEYRINQINQKQ